MKQRYQIKHKSIAFVFKVINFIGYSYYYLSLRFLFRRPLVKNPKKILTIQLDGIGDVLLSTPAIKELKNNFPNAKIDVLVADHSKEILILNPNIDKVIIYNSILLYKKYRSFKQLMKNLSLISKLKGRNYDVIIDLRADIRSILVAWLIGGKNRISQDIRSGGFLLTHTVPYKGLVHEVERKLDIIKFITKREIENEPKLETYWQKNDEQRIKKILERKNIKNFVIIHPLVPWKPREWPKERFAKVADWIIENKDLDIIFVGSKEEKEEINEIISLMKTKKKQKAHNFASLVTIKQLAALIKKAKLFLGNDSGIMHIADAVEIPLIALFGPQDPRRYGPISKNSRVIYHKVPCSPCSQTKCKLEPSCMERIRLEEVIQVINSILKNQNVKN